MIRNSRATDLKAPQGLKPSTKKEGLIAALKALRHPKIDFLQHTERLHPG